MPPAQPRFVAQGASPSQMIVLDGDPAPAIVPPILTTGIPALMTRLHIHNMFCYGHNARLAMDNSPEDDVDINVEGSAPMIRFSSQRCET